MGTRRGEEVLRLVSPSVWVASLGVRWVVSRVVKSAGPKGHILNLGHGVLVKTPEEAVAHFFDVTRSLRYDTLFQGCVTEVLEPVA
uniref:Uroporphyrinogen decarboxylase (URO-D) domain-containing protein n=1 Tax=Oryza meridionalis TaxID=40149 RepID=A0A0E0C4T2_9ORYZ